METKQVYGRIQQKHDIEANWEKAEKFKPLKGEIIIYDMYDNNGDKVSNRVRHKIGDGINYVNDLPFVDDKFIHVLDNHNNTGTILDGTDISIQSMDDLMQSGMVFVKLYSSNNSYPDQEDFELLSLYYFNYGDATYEFRSTSTSLTIIDDSIEIHSIPQFNVDTNLTRSGYAADAKAVGDALKGYIKKGESENETATVIGSGNATGDSSTVIGTGTAAGTGATVIGSGTAEGNGSVVFGNGTAFSDNSVAIGNSATAGCKGFYIAGVEGKRTLILSSKQGESAWGVDEEELLSEWLSGDEINYKNDTRYVLKSVIESVDPAAPSVIVKEDLPFDSLVVISSPLYDEYSITNPRKPQSGIVTFAEGAFTAGINNSAAGTASISLGQNNLSAGEWSYTEGYDNTAVGTCSHVEGFNNKAGNAYSHVEGRDNTTTGHSTHVEGYGNIVTATAAHAEGRSNEANGLYSHVEGGASKANGLRSHAQGHATQANATDSHAEGDSTIASSTSQHVQGKFNIADVIRNENGDMLNSEGNVVTDYRDAAPANKYAHIIGNGTDNKNRSNAHTVDWDGNAWYAGRIQSQGSYVPVLNDKNITAESVYSSKALFKRLSPVINEIVSDAAVTKLTCHSPLPMQAVTATTSKLYIVTSQNLLSMTTPYSYSTSSLFTSGEAISGSLTYTRDSDGSIIVKGKPGLSSSGSPSRGTKVVGEVYLPAGTYTYFVTGANDDVYGQLHYRLDPTATSFTSISTTVKSSKVFTLSSAAYVSARIILKSNTTTELDDTLKFWIVPGDMSEDTSLRYHPYYSSIVDINGSAEVELPHNVKYAYSTEPVSLTMYGSIEQTIQKSYLDRVIHSGSEEPSPDLGVEGDIYIMI